MGLAGSTIVSVAVSVPYVSAIVTVVAMALLLRCAGLRCPRLLWSGRELELIAYLCLSPTLRRGALTRPRAGVDIGWHAAYLDDNLVIGRCRC